jgi:hypothetical protein
MPSRAIAASRWRYWFRNRAAADGASPSQSATGRQHIARREPAGRDTTDAELEARVSNVALCCPGRMRRHVRSW